MNKKTLRCNKIFAYYLLFIWICGLSVAQPHDDLFEDFNEVENEHIESPIRNSHSGERQQALRKALREQLEYHSHNDDHLVSKDHEDDDTNKPKTNQRENTNPDEEELSSEEEVQEYNPWQDSFQDINEDGTYIYGYSLPNGVTRYERSFFSEKYKGRVVEGFHTEPRYYGNGIRYELRCYRADYYGFRPLTVQYLRRPPIVRRDTEPNVDCFDQQ